jgi:hypothetical protein
MRMRKLGLTARVPVAGRVITGRAVEEDLALNIADGLKELPGAFEIRSGGFWLFLRSLSQPLLCLL